MLPTTKDAETIFDLAGKFLDAEQEHRPSLSAFNKTTAIVSNTYIEEGLHADDIMLPLMSVLNQTYLTMVLAAVRLSNATSFNVVKKGLSRVATEEYAEKVSKEDLIEMLEGNVSQEAKVLDVEKSIAHLAIGKLLEVEFTIPNKDGDTTKVTVPISMSILPTLVKPSTVSAFLSSNFKESFSKRWARFKAREISFFKDLIFSRDLLAKRKQQLKDDPNNQLANMLGEANRKKAKGIISALRSQPKNNLASSIVITSKSTTDEFEKEQGVKIDNYGDRQKFFQDSMALMLVVVDTAYETVEIYFNSMREVMEVPYNYIEKNGSANNSVDMKTLLAAMSKGTLPKF
jgi:hypothetical protein